MIETFIYNAYFIKDFPDNWVSKIDVLNKKICCPSLYDFLILLKGNLWKTFKKLHLTHHMFTECTIILQ